MIEVATGRIGGGKTCMAIYRICRYIADGGCVFTNIRLLGVVESFDIDSRKPVYILGPDAPIRSFLRKRYKWEYQDGQYNYILPDAMDDGFQTVIPPGTPDKKVLIVLDEVNEWFDSIDRSKVQTDAAYRATLRFLRQSRKVYTDSMFILQDFNTLNSRIRGLVGYVWICRDMEYFEVAGVRLGWLLKRFFVWQKFDGTGRFPCRKPRWVAKDLEIFGLYDTTEIFGDGLGILPAGSFRTDFRGSGRIVKKGKKMNKIQTALLVLCCLSSAFCAVFISRSSGSFSGPGARVVVVTNFVGSARSALSPASGGYPRSEWAPITYGRAGDVVWAYVGGRMYRPGFHVDRGVVVSVEQFAIRIVGDDGEDYWIFHSDGSGVPGPSVSKGGGVK